MTTKIINANDSGWNVSGVEKNRIQKKENDKNIGKDNKSNVIDARGLTTSADADVQSRVEQTRANARKKALKLIKDAWNTDENLARTKRDIDDQRSSLITENNSAYTKIDELDQRRDVIIKNSEIDPDSEEYKDLELLEKYQRNAYGDANDSFTEDEYKRLGELQDKPLTQLQHDVLSIGAQRIREKSKVDNNKAALLDIFSNEHDLLMTQLQSQDMIKAQASSDDLLDAADKDVVSLVGNDALQKAQEKQKEQEKEASEAEEKADEKEERLNSIKEKREEQEQHIEIQQDANAQAQNDAVQMDHSDQGQMVRNASHLEAAKNINTVNTTADSSSSHVAEVQKQLSSEAETFKITREDLLGLRIDVML